MNLTDKALSLVRSDAESVLSSRTEPLRPLAGSHVFVSGGTGFLGVWLLELMAVLNERHDFGLRVTVFSRNARAFAAECPHLGSLSRVRFVDGDIRYLPELPRETRYIVHAAALTDRRLFASHPTAVAETNSLGTARLLQAANLLEDVRKIVVLSSGLIYGRQPCDMANVNEDFMGPLPCDDVNAVYAESKRFAEVIAHCAISESKLPVVVLRPFAFIGPYQSLQLPWAVTDFLRDSLNGSPIRIMGKGNTVRSLMYASDYAYWTLAALAQGKPRATYNVGSPYPIDLLSLARMITQHFSPPPEILTNVGQSSHETTRLVPCVERARRELGVDVTVSLPDAVQKTITWHRTNPVL
jgi:nucleoside-diphosphate-sugar epimerase